MAEGLHAANLAWIRARTRRARTGSTALDALFDAACQGDGTLLRISPQRTVLQLDRAGPASVAGQDGWLLKISHPRRRTEWLRRRFSPAPAVREHERLALLAARMGVAVPAWSVVLPGGVSLFARPYWSGRPARPDQQTARGLAELHALRWSDRDASLADLVFADAWDGRLVPLDLGQARIGAFPLAPDVVYRDLVRLASGLDVDAARAWAPELLEAHRETLPGWDAARLVRRAAELRRRRAWRRSARAFRPCSDFETHAGGARRRSTDAEVTPPAIAATSAGPATAGETATLADGPRSRSLRHGDTVWKFYRRPGALEAVRRTLRTSPGARAYRALAFLEILGTPAARPLAWQPERDGEWLATRWVDGAPADAGALGAITDWLARLHELGAGLRDAKPDNFRLRPDGGVVLVDGDGLRPHGADRVRDCARLFAEVPADDPRLAELRARYEQRAGAFTPAEASGLLRRAARFRDALARADQPATRGPAATEGGEVVARREP